MKASKMISTNKFKNTSEISLQVPGQGIFLFEATDSASEGDITSCSFIFQNKDNTDGLLIEYTADAIKVKRTTSVDPYLDPTNSKGLIPLQGIYYWFSLDAQNQQLYAGIGEARLETYLYRYQLPFSNDDERKANKKFLESLISIQLLSNVKPLRLVRDPITKSIPLLIKSTEELTMEAIGRGLYMPHANLSTISQKMFHCISGENFKLNTDDFADFSKAIEHSIKSPDGWCYKKLQDKSTEFNKDKPNVEETYLRITLGQNNGESPGIPYVMEIWPPGHYSPIHNHAGAEAVIRVLYGDIHVLVFPFLSKDNVLPFAEVDFTQGDLTWISPTLNQTHQLKNIHADRTCITIQCYMYDQEDLAHYDYFDYIDGNGAVQQYEPDSDMDFVDFKKLIKDEWEAAEFNKTMKKEWNEAVEKQAGCFSCF